MCVLGISKCMEKVWKRYNFHRYIPRDEGNFKFCRMSWLRNVSFETPLPPRGLTHTTVTSGNVSVIADGISLNAVMLDSGYILISIQNPGK